MSKPKPRIRTTSDGRCRAVLKGVDGCPLLGPRETAEKAVQRARKAMDAERRARIWALGAIAESKERRQQYEREHKITRVMFA